MHAKRVQGLTNEIGIVTYYMFSKKKLITNNLHNKMIIKYS